MRTFLKIAVGALFFQVHLGVKIQTFRGSPANLFYKLKNIKSLKYNISGPGKVEILKITHGLLF